MLSSGSEAAKRERVEVERAGRPGQPIDIDELLERARGLERSGQYEEAAALLSAQLDYDDRIADLSFRLASVRLKQDRLDEAEELLRRSAALRYEDARVHTNLGVVHDRRGDTAEAIRAFRRAIQLAPRETTAHLNLGALYGEVGRYDDAIRSLKRCLAIAPSFDGSFNLALVYFRRGELEEAERYFNDALSHDASSGLCHFYRGQCLYRRGLIRDAVEAFGHTLTHEPELARARFYRGMALNKLDCYGAAVQDLQRAAKALADDGRVHYQLGIAYDGLTLKAEARESYRRARTLAG